MGTIICVLQMRKLKPQLLVFEVIHPENVRSGLKAVLRATAPAALSHCGMRPCLVPVLIRMRGVASASPRGPSVAAEMNSQLVQLLPWKSLEHTGCLAA